MSVVIHLVLGPSVTVTSGLTHSQISSPSSEEVQPPGRPLSPVLHSPPDIPILVRAEVSGLVSAHVTEIKLIIAVKIISKVVP